VCQHGGEARSAYDGAKLPDAGVAFVVRSHRHEEDHQRLVEGVAHVDPKGASTVNLKCNTWM